MWLPNVQDLSNIYLESFNERNTPPYAILSHTWLEDQQEISFQDIQHGLHVLENQSKAGYQKVYQCCVRSQSDGYSHCWIDTCCIDKRSSAELSEAINSMFLWYQEAGVCYAYLADVDDRGNTWKAQFEWSRWFTRGWTLQELLAPREVIFFGQGWSALCTRSEHVHHIRFITGITIDYLSGRRKLSEACAATRMSWAAKRSTTRTEDMAYCLLGIFGVNMTLLYGERDKAFIRLQEEFLKGNDDQSILVWNPSDNSPRGALARSPADFAASDRYQWDDGAATRHPMRMTARGLEIEMLFTVHERQLVGLLPYSGSIRGTISIPLRSKSGTLEMYEEVYRPAGSTLIEVPPQYVWSTPRTSRTVYICDQYRAQSLNAWHFFCISAADQLPTCWSPKCRRDRHELGFWVFEPLACGSNSVILVFPRPSNRFICLSIAFDTLACGAITPEMYIVRGLAEETDERTFSYLSKWKPGLGLIDLNNRQPDFEWDKIKIADAEPRRCKDGETVLMDDVEHQLSVQITRGTMETQGRRSHMVDVKFARESEVY